MFLFFSFFFFFFQAEDGIRDFCLSRGLGDVYKRQALQIKKSVVGNGHADKLQVQTMVQKLLKLPSLPGSDSGDALACAICHANISDSLGRLGVGNRMKSGRII